MKTRLLLFFFLGWACLLSARSVVREQIDWPAFMARQDMVWETLPAYWYEAPFMGNGTLGLMLYKEPGENYLRLETGNCDVHDHRGKGLLGNPRLLTGHFALHPKGEIISGTMRLRLWDALTEAEIVTTEGKIRLEAWVHADRMVMAVKGVTEGNEAYTLEWIPAIADSPRYLYSKTDAGAWIAQSIVGYQSNPAPEITASAKRGTSLQKLLSGGETAVCWEQIDKKKEHTLWISLKHTYPEDGAVAQARAEIDHAIGCGYKKMCQSHADWWHGFYPKSFLTLEDGEKENFYWIQMYKLASATRADRSLIDNTGPWLTVTPWPNAWWNLNVQLTYWPLNTSNHLDLAASLERAVYGHTENLRNNVPEPYRHDSYGIGRTSDTACDSEVVGVPGESKNAEIGLLTWTCHNLWLIYRHKMDDRLLRDQLFPLLKGAVNYYLHFVYKGEDGKYHLPRTYSPEYGSAEDCNFDLALLKWGCGTLLGICERLNLTDALIPTWRDIEENLTPYPADENGLMIGKDTPYAFSHRHYSHLLAVYPLYLIHGEQAGIRELIARSLAWWQSKPDGLRGYSSTGGASIAAAIGNGNEALRYLQQLFTEYLGVNTLYRESGPVIETPLSGAQSIHDMLLQSWGNKLRFFPAVPDAWKNVTYHNWRTEGAFLVSAQRKDGQTRFVRIYSEAGEPCVIAVDMSCPVFEGARTFAVEKVGEHTYRIDLKKGEEVLIHEEGTEAVCQIEPVEAVRANCFGKKLPSQKE